MFLIGTILKLTPVEKIYRRFDYRYCFKTPLFASFRVDQNKLINKILSLQFPKNKYT